MEGWRAVGATATGWLQMASLFLGIVVAWVMYVSLVLRYAWVPRFIDLVFPFLIGLLEFLLASSLGPDRVTTYLVVLAAVFLVASGSSFGIFSVLVEEGTVSDPPMAKKLRSYVPTAAAVVMLLIFSAVTSATGPASTGTFLGLLAACTGLLAQLLSIRHYWAEDMGR